MALEVEYAHRTDSENQANIYYDIGVVNNGSIEYSIRSCVVEWRYYPGMGFGGGYGDVLVASRPYVIDLKIDVEHWTKQARTGFLSSWLKESQPIQQEFSIEPAAVVRPSQDIADLHLQLHYSFEGAIQWHTRFEWNILFRVIAIASPEAQFELLPENFWRTPM